MATILVSTKDMACDEWLHWRKRGIGGSDAATICGINKYKSAFQLWMEKTGQYNQAVDNEPAYWGYVLEPVIRDEFTKRTGLPVALEQNLLQHERYPYMLANLDGIVKSTDTDYIFEAKTSSAFRLQEWDLDCVPYPYQLQVQHYMAVTGLSGAYVAALIGGQEFRVQFISRDEEIINMLIKLEGQFWQYVENNTPPPIDGTDAAKDFINARFPKAIARKSIVLDDGYLSLVSKYEQFQEFERVNAELKDKAANQLKELIGDCESATVGDRIITWKNVTSERLDIKRLQIELPDVYNKYLNKSSHRRFLIKR